MQTKVRDYEKLIAGLPQNLRTNPDVAFQLLRIGAAVLPRDIDAAIYDVLRLKRPAQNLNRGIPFLLTV